MAHLAGRGYGIKTFVFIGRMTTLPHAREIFDRLERLYQIHLLVPEDATYMTAIGAASTMDD
jgi:type II pantothenate kinase